MRYFRSLCNWFSPFLLSLVIRPIHVPPCHFLSLEVERPRCRGQVARGLSEVLPVELRGPIGARLCEELHTSNRRGSMPATGRERWEWWSRTASASSAWMSLPRCDEADSWRLIDWLGGWLVGERLTEFCYAFPWKRNLCGEGCKEDGISLEFLFLVLDFVSFLICKLPWVSGQCMRSGLIFEVLSFMAH